ncbi:MAG: CoA-binding protein [candidate division Zixibacteria bacterium]|nr:CoA-binding protein [candidate division Zixibacteria bacterium]MDH3936953.1 CoA-binding protein [candidate division Zixibacteria bacterium]MDH4033454.1 CoA-binding protein [candidate division Zixibacteria bacterium]
MTNANPNSTVAVLGASTNEERFSFKAVRMLKEYGHNPIPVHPAGHVVDGITAVKVLTEAGDGIDTLTIYVNAKISGGEFDNILNLKPRRVVFNPGAENPELADKLRDAGFEVVEACTLVMLQSGQF